MAINRSKDTGKLTATARVTLVQEQEEQYGVVVFLPVYGRQDTPITVASRRAALRGFVLGVFRIGDMVTSALKDFPPDTIRYSLYDHTAPEGEQLLWEHHPEIQSNKFALQNSRNDSNSAVLGFHHMYDMGERKWTTFFATTAA